MQLPPPVKPPPPLPTRFRSDGAVDPGSSLFSFAQVAIHNHVSAKKIAHYSLDITHTWLALKERLEDTLFRPGMLRCPTVIFMEPMENTVDLKDSVLVSMRTNGLHRIAVAVDAEFAEGTILEAPPANLPKAPEQPPPQRRRGTAR